MEGVRGSRNWLLGPRAGYTNHSITAFKWPEVQGEGWGVPFLAPAGNALLGQLGLTFSGTVSPVRKGERQLWVFPFFQMGPSV